VLEQRGAIYLKVFSQKYLILRLDRRKSSALDGERDINFWPVEFSRRKLRVSRLYNDSYSGLTKETKKKSLSVPSHVQRVGSSASCASFFTGQELTNDVYKNAKRISEP
jgi:hypothetical protein